MPRKIGLPQIARRFGGEYIPAENCVKIKNMGIVEGGLVVEATITPTEFKNKYYVNTHIGKFSHKIETDASGEVVFSEIFNSPQYLQMQAAGKELSAALHQWIREELECR